MLMLLFLFALVLGAVSPSDRPASNLQRGACPPFWFSFDDRCYSYVSTYFSWADAELHCLSRGANLVSIHSLEEQNFVRNLIRNFDPAEGRTWIGLTDIHKEGSWMWSDGSLARFFYWLPGEPNNSGGREHCAECNFGTTRRWNDESCSRGSPSVCATQKCR